MGKSLIIRGAIILVVLLAWGASLSHMTGKPFYPTFRELAAEADMPEPKDDDKADERPLIDRLIERSKEIQEEKKTTAAPECLLIAATEMGIKLRTVLPVPTKPEATNKQVVSFVRRKSDAWLHYGQDLKGGWEITIAYDPDKIEEDENVKRSVQLKNVQDEIIEILRNRIDQSGMLEAEIMGRAAGVISIKIPHVSDAELTRIERILTQIAVLEFRMLFEPDSEMRRLLADNEIPSGYERKVIKATSEDEPDETVLISRFPEAVKGEHVSYAQPLTDPNLNYYVSMTFDSKGTKLFCQLTQANIGKRMGIVLDGNVYSAPTIQGAICGGQGQITGNFTADEASQLAIVMRSGSLPVKIEIDSRDGTAPTLGQAYIDAGITASKYGLGAVFVFMLIYYLLSGAIANLALAANIVLVLGTLTIQQGTLTLPGIAGIVLVIGMAVDANVLIFERIREELSHKKSIGNAIHSGYDRAMITILDANITTLLTALVLYWFGSGPIRGFAMTLSIGIIASMFTALFMTRWMFDVLLHFSLIKNLKMRHVFRKPKVGFLKLSPRFMIMSGVLVVLAVAIAGTRGADAFSVDFTGGHAVALQYEQEADIEEVRQALKDSGFKNPKLNYKGLGSQKARVLEIVVRESNQDNINNKNKVPEYIRIGNILQKKFPESKFSGGSSEKVGGLVGAAFRKQALLAICASLAVLIVYVSFRFELAYALGAVAALIHDTLISVGVFLLPLSIIGERQISLTVVAAILTILGYSLNDTIVIFDRIRENAGLETKKSFRDIIDMSINQTLSRTVLTSVSTLIVVLTLLVYGGGAINDFALVLLIGVISGTYSSVFIATPVMLFFHNLSQKSAQPPTTAPASHGSGDNAGTRETVPVTS